MTPQDQMTDRERHDEVWRQLRARFKLSQNGKWPGWDSLAKAAYDLGYHDYARAWGYAPPKAPPPERYL